MSSGLRLHNFLLLLIVWCPALRLVAATPITYQYIYDSAGQLTNVIDSTGVIVQYVYDAAGNITQINRGTANSALSILSFNPPSGGPGATVTIVGAGFSPTPASNTVTFNGAAATVSAATANTLTVTVPNNATTGPIAVSVAGKSIASSSSFTVLAAPIISSINPPYLLAGQSNLTIVVTGVNLTAANFTAQPATVPAALTITKAVVTATTATLTLSTGASAASAVLIATNAVGNSGIFGSSSNSLAILIPLQDSDGDGLTNAQEIAAGTNPLVVDTDGDGLPDGWEVYYGLNPLDPSDAGKPSKAGDGLTNLQEFKAGTDPTNVTRTVPVLTSSTPANGATGQPINTSIFVVFNEAVLSSSQITALQKILSNVTPGVITVSAGGVPVQGTSTLSPDGTHLTFTPAQNLAITTTYTITATGFRSLSGVPQSAPAGTTFTTNAVADVTPPTITRTSPSNNMTAVPINALYQVQFSKPIDPTSLTPGKSFEVYDTVTGIVVAGTVVSDSSGRIATFKPTNPFAVGRQLNVYLSQNGQIQDLSGNKLAGVTFAFATGFSPDTTPPAIKGNSPQTGDASIGVNVQVMIDFTKPINEISAVQGVTVTQNGSAVPGAFTFQNNDTRMLFVPTAPYIAGAVTVTTTQGLTDVAGDVITNTVAYTFTVDSAADTVTPFVTVLNPPPNAVNVGRNVVLQTAFSERANQLTVTSATFYVVDGNNGAVIPGALFVASNRRTAIFTPTNPFAANERYCWYLNTLTDLSGNALNSIGNCFITGAIIDTTPPVITQVNPSNGATAVPLNTVIVGQSSKPLNAFTFQSGGALLPLTTGASNKFDLGFFAGGTSLTLATGGTGALSGSSYQVNPDGSVIGTVTGNLSYANTGAKNYPIVGGLGDGVNHFAGGGANYDLNNSIFGFAGKQTTDTTDPAVIRLGSLVGTYKSAPALTDWFPLGYGQKLTIPGSGADLYLAVNDSYSPDNTGNFVVTSAYTGAPAPVITLIAGTTNVPGVGSLSTDGLNVSFTPASPLLAATTYKINISGATDYVGNVLAPFSSTFSTGNTSDSTQPVIISFSPATGTKSVPVNTAVVITFSKFIDPLTVNNTNIYVYQQSTGIQLSGTFKVDNSGANAAGAVVTFTPASNLPSASVIVVNVNSVQDFAGNNNQSASISFTTVGVVDAVPPTVTSVTPTDGSTNLGLNTTISLTFSKPLNPNTINNNNFALFNGSTRLSTSIGHSQDLQTVNLSTGLPNNVTITVIATSGVADLSGNALTDFRSSFTTVQVGNTTRPSIIGQRPGNGTTQVPSISPVVFFANAPLNPATVGTTGANGALHVSQNGVIVPGTVALSSNNQAVQFTPAAPFVAGDYVQVFMDSTATDANGNALYNYQSSFTVAPALTATPIAATSSVPAYGTASVPINAPVTIAFNKPIDATTVNTSTTVASPTVLLVFCNNSQVVPAAVSLLSPNVIQITPTSKLFPSFNYCYSVSTALKDTNGLALANTFSGYFATGTATDTAQPRVSSITPPDTITNVGTNAPIEIRFDKPLNPITVSTGNIQITSGGVAISPISINFVSGNTQDVLLTPTTVLPDLSKISISISGVQDPAGNLVVPFTGSFTTRAGLDLANANLISSNPFNGAQNVPTNTSITLQFDKAVDPATVNSNGISLYDTVTGQYLAGTYSVSANALTATFAPAASLGIGRLYYVYYGSGVHDLAGNYLIGGSFSFTTAITPSSTKPLISLSSPESNQSGVPINARIQVQFNEPLQTGSISDVTLSAGGTVVPGIIGALSAGNTLLTVTPPALLTGNTSYSLSLAGVLDVAGNALTPAVTLAFTTASGADLLYPSVVAYNPPNTTVRVGTNIAPAIVYSKPMDVITFNTSTVYIVNESTGQVVPSTVSPSADRTAVQIKPNSTLPTSTYFCFYAYGVTDLAGNSTSAGSCFYTGLGPDVTAPVISSSTPPNGATVAINAKFQFLASKQISPLSFNASTAVTITATSGNTVLAGAAALASDLQTITFTPKANLAASTNYMIKVSGFSDLLGNLVTPFTSMFVTNATGVSDTVSPIILSSTPANGAKNIATNTTVVLNVSKPINPITVNAANVRVYLQSSGLNVAGAYALANTATAATITFTPTSPIPASAVVVVSVNSLQDYAGNLNQGFSTSFTTAATVDNQPPTVTSVTPSNNSTNLGLYTTVSLTFSKSINPSTINTNNFALFNGTTRLSISVSYSSDYLTVTLSPGQLPANGNIQVVATGGVQDLSGNALVAFQSFFSTVPAADANRPSITMQRPGNGATQVATGTPVTVFFNKAMDPGTTPPAMSVSQNGALIAGTAVLSGNGQVLTFTPSSPIVSGSLVQVFVASSAMDTFGNQLNGYAGSFTTVPNLTSVAPVVTGNVPAYGASGVVVNPVIEMQFSKPLDPTTVTPSTVGLFFQQNNQNVNTVTTVTISLSANHKSIFIAPQSLSSSFSYYFQANTGVKDATGLALASAYTSYFQTGSGTDLVQPRVLTVTPPDKSVGVGVNAPVYLHFSKPLNTLSVSAGASGTIQITAAGNPISPASISFGSNQDVTITPFGTFPDNTPIGIAATAGLQDLAGNALVPFSSTFTTRTGTALSPANVTNAVPVNGTINIPVNSIVQLKTDNAIDPTTVNVNSFALYDNTAGGNPLPGTYSVSPGGTVVTFAPASNLTLSDAYRFYWNSNMHDISGNYLNGGSSGFTASSAAVTAAPTVLATNPPNAFTNVPTNLTVQVLFSEPVQPSAISGVTLSTGSTTLPVTAVLSNGNQTLTLIPPSLLTPLTSYKLTIAGVVDLANNALASTVNQSFTTGSGPVLVALSASTITPASSATGVSTSVAPVVVVNTPLNPLSLPGNFVLYNSSTNQVVPWNSFALGGRAHGYLHPKCRARSEYSVLYSHGQCDGSGRQHDQWL